MKITTLLLAVVAVFTLATAKAAAQPALERLEKKLEQANPQPAELPPPVVKPPVAAEPGYLGILGDDRQENGRGVRIVDVFAGGPAERSGLRRGDLIMTIGGRAIRTMDELGVVVAGQRVGSKLAMLVERQGAQRRLDVTLGRRAAPPAAAPQPTLPRAVDTQQRINELEERIRQLELRIGRLERDAS